MTHVTQNYIPYLNLFLTMAKLCQRINNNVYVCKMETQIISLNVRGLGNTEKRKQVFEWFKSNNYDILLLQEVHC